MKFKRISTLILMMSVWTAQTPGWAYNVKCEVRLTSSNWAYMAVRDPFSSDMNSVTEKGDLRLRLHAWEGSYDDDFQIDVELEGFSNRELLFKRAWQGSMDDLKSGRQKLDWEKIQSKRFPEGLSVGCAFEP